MAYYNGLYIPDAYKAPKPRPGAGQPRRGGSGTFPRPGAGQPRRGGSGTFGKPKPVASRSTTRTNPPPSQISTTPGRPAPRVSAPAPSGVGRSPTGSISSFAGDGGGGGGGSSFAGGESFAAPAVAPAQTEDEWLTGDSTYQDQLLALTRALEAFKGQQATAGTRFDTNQLNQKSDLGKAETMGFRDLENDYGSRNMLQSGLYGDAFAKTGEDFARRRADLATGKSDYDSNRGIELTNYTAEQGLTSQRARAEAIARRANSLAL